VSRPKRNPSRLRAVNEADVKVASKPTRVWKADNLPPGYDPDIWYLANAFHSEAEEYEVDYHRFKIYAELKTQLEASGIMTQDASSNEELEHLFQFIRWQFGTQRRVGKPMVDISDRELSGPKWRQFVEIMVVIFWADANAYTEFGDKDPLGVFTSNVGFHALLDRTASDLVTSKSYRKVENN
jgi:hypothetical protein